MLTLSQIRQIVREIEMQCIRHDAFPAQTIRQVYQILIWIDRVENRVYRWYQDGKISSVMEAELKQNLRDLRITIWKSWDSLRLRKAFLNYFWSKSVPGLFVTDMRYPTRTKVYWLTGIDKATQFHNGVSKRRKLNVCTICRSTEIRDG